MQTEKNIINLTDHSFQKICHSEYGINRGVYNVIDEWFYDQGIHNIMSRRREILSFIEYCARTLGNRKVKYGHGGLTRKLCEYLEEAKQPV
ncbi:hypothetical protein [Planococcus salinus]|uniref:Uncharacterized protein n=1 Tax=Planococcus salinus TaxID=1848460 RepID=A0A3M8P9D4_9BACL|nr:hypothetical protein [Planococcus salinus]RNF39794.1 hypothetical protein EEX84_07450 [Planococcus salinus]